jgi:hypothetical protein
MLYKTETLEYDYSIPFDAGINGYLIKDELRFRHYDYDDIICESPIFKNESIQGQEAVLVQDDSGTTVRVGQPADINGVKNIVYDNNTHELLYSYEQRETSIWPVTVGDDVNQLVKKKELQKEVYHRSGGKLFVVASSRANETPVFGTAPSTETNGTMNSAVPVQAINYDTSTNVQESFGDTQRGVGKKRKLQVKAESGSTDICADAFEISNSNIIVPKEAQEIADYIYSEQSAITATHAAVITATLHNETTYSIGTTFKDSDNHTIPGKVVGQNIVINMGSGVLGFDLTNTVTVQAKYRVKNE